MAISEDLGAIIRDNFAHNPTKEQEIAITELADFLLSRMPEQLFLLRGYAGTGKTSLLAAVVRTMRMLGQRVSLIAPTGRAAKVLSTYAGMPAYTIHKKIYRQKSLVDMNSFQQDVNLQTDTLFIVDEASMIGGDSYGSMFGTGRLLDDLIQYVYSCDGCRLLMVGDTAQLPPVGEEESPALSRLVLEGYGLQVTELELTQVVRQLEESGILWNATMLRQLICRDEVYAFPRMRTQGFPDIRVMPGDELIESLDDSYRQYGTDGTIIVTRSNKRAIIFNNGVRGRILDYDAELSGGDLVMVAKNNYYWTELEQAEQGVRKPGSMPFIANGDIALVRRFRGERSFYGFRFADVTLMFPDYDRKEMDVTVLLDTLQSEAPALTREQQQKLFDEVWADYPEIRNQRDRMKRLRQDPYYNALQIKYAYAVTCHKAQGGQWEHVYIDQGYITEEMLTPDYFRWLYTAITRATKKVFLVNWPKDQLELSS